MGWGGTSHQGDTWRSQEYYGPDATERGCQGQVLPGRCWPRGLLSNLSEVPPGDEQLAPFEATGSCLQGELCFGGELVRVQGCSEDKFASAINNATVARMKRHVSSREAFDDDMNLRVMCSSGKWVGYRREGWGDVNAEANVDKPFLAVDYFGML